MDASNGYLGSGGNGSSGFTAYPGSGGGGGYYGGSGGSATDEHWVSQSGGGGGSSYIGGVEYGSTLTGQREGNGLALLQFTTEPVEEIIIDENFDFCLHVGANLVSSPCTNLIDINITLPAYISNNLTGIITEGGRVIFLSIRLVHGDDTRLAPTCKQKSKFSSIIISSTGSVVNCKRANPLPSLCPVNVLPYSTPPI
jgi:hypothetical protein